MTPYNTVIQGDCRAVLKCLPDNISDLVLTDPPYLVDYHDRQGRSIIGDKEGDWLMPAFSRKRRISSGANGAGRAGALSPRMRMVILSLS